MFSWLKSLFSSALSRKKRNAEWDARFTQASADTKNTLPLEPENDPWRK